MGRFMTITSLTFLLFIFAVLIVYYLVPKKLQWCVLLAASLIFYCYGGIKTILYVLITASSVYAATRWMHRLSVRQKQFLQQNKATLSKEDKAQYKAKIKKRRKALMLAALLLNIGILCAFKYVHFAIEQVNSVAALFGGSGIEDTLNWAIPLGISFYTFQSVGYLVDVYWEYYEPEKNYFKVLLFVSFFPQMTQGPISDFEALSTELFSEHRLDYKNYSWGFQRMLWGFMKKMVIADYLSPCVSDVFANYSQYSGVSVLIGAFMYSIQIYADFSGYMDIMCGYCEMLGIRLSENFERPYFSKSITEYWRRWHITLGAWFKKYIYYPIGMSTWSRSLAKKTKKRFGQHFADTFPATIALVIVWSATGLWHGASWAYIVWGLVNGLFIILSLWMTPVYDKWKKGLRIRERSTGWRAFQVIRTFILVTVIKVLPEVGTLSDGLGLWKQVLTEHTIPASVHGLLPFVKLTCSLDYICFGVAVIGIMLLFIASFLQRKQALRELFNRLPCLVRIVALVSLSLVIITFGVQASWHGEGFLYANF